MNIWKSVKTTEFPKEKKFDIFDVRGIVITSNFKGERKVTMEKKK